MKKSFTLAFVLLLPLLLASCSQEGATGGERAALQTPESFEQKSSYAVGMDIGNNIKRMGGDFETEYLLAGLGDVLDGKEPAITTEEATEVMGEFRRVMQEKSDSERQAQAEGNKKAGTEFLAENATKEGVITTESGLQYMVLEEGDGPKPTAENTVSVHYRGTLLDGTEFDSSYGRGQPATFPLGGVIPGWTEGVQLMNVGSKYKFFIPSDLAYGDRGAGGTIGPGATLIFEVELLEIVE